MNEKELIHIDLFSGIGGFALAAKWAGFKTIAFCEKEEFCQKVLQKRFGAVIADPKGQRCNGLTEREKWESMGIKRNNSASKGTPIVPEIRDFDGTQYKGAALLTGGFPCQPFSVAGKRRGKEDDRYLWPQMRRVINEAKPRWILAENVPGIFHMALDTVLADLESEGYTTGTFIIPACALNAPHKRNRIWIIAHTIDSNDTKDRRRDKKADRIQKEYRKEKLCDRRTSGADRDVADSKSRLSREQTEQERGEGIGRGNIENDSDSSSKGLPESQESQFNESLSHAQRGDWQKDWYEVATQFCGIFDGFSDWLDKYWRKINEESKKSISRKDLQVLWQQIQKEEIWQKIRGLYEIPEKGILQSVLCKLKNESKTQNNILFEGEKIHEECLRKMWNWSWLGYPSYRRKHQEQQTRKYNDSLPFLSHEIALATESLFKLFQIQTNTNNRIHRLKALGNAIVPQIAYEILKNIAWIERNKLNG